MAEIGTVRASGTPHGVPKYANVEQFGTKRAGCGAVALGSWLGVGAHSLYPFGFQRDRSPSHLVWLSAGRAARSL